MLCDDDDDYIIIIKNTFMAINNTFEIRVRNIPKHLFNMFVYIIHYKKKMYID